MRFREIWLISAEKHRSASNVYEQLRHKIEIILELNDYENGDLNFYNNPMRLKNFYDSDYQLPTDSKSTVLSGIRNYIGIGTMQDSIWLSYKQTSNLDNATNLLKDFFFIERIKGFYKLKSNAKHKSNFYSIKIKDSGLNSDLDNNLNTMKLDDGATINGPQAKSILQGIVSGEIVNMLEKIAPSNTQLWKIVWEGK